ncbi:MAG TPA: DUF1848 family protein [Candidatus Deferrimicrobiaceae bacterium]
MPHIVSASRRTDIPQFHGAWFAARRKAGFCEARTVFGTSYRVSLRPEDVIAWLFWTKNSRAFEAQLRALLDEGAAVAVQFTLNGYGPAIEANIPGPEVTVPAFLRASKMLPSPAAIQWRYDPVVVSDAFDAAWHRANFRRIASRLEGATRVCNTSIVEPYDKVVRRMGCGVAYRRLDRDRHRSVARKYPGLRQAGEEEKMLLSELADIASGHGIALRACCGPETGLPPASCCGAELFEVYGMGDALRAVSPAPTRKGCRCLKAQDIGMDNTCPGGCSYCYVTGLQATAARNWAERDPGAARMR